MPSFLFMKILESTPERYDRGIALLSGGRINRIYERIASEFGKGESRILELGCGTGNLSIACARKGAKVTALDINPGMLEVAMRKTEENHLEDRIEYLEIGVAEIHSYFKGLEFDSCVSCLAFSELTEDEQTYAISAAYSILKPGGLMIIADEVKPLRISMQLYRAIVGLPLKIMAYILTQSTTRPLRDLTPIMTSTGFTKIQEERMWKDSFIYIRAQKGGKE